MTTLLICIQEVRGSNPSLEGNYHEVGTISLSIFQPIRLLYLKLSYRIRLQTFPKSRFSKHAQHSMLYDLNALDERQPPSYTRDSSREIRGTSDISQAVFQCRLSISQYHARQRRPQKRSKHKHIKN